MKLSFLYSLALFASAQTWSLQTSGISASLRGVSAVDAKNVWASGSGATWLRTTDGGLLWHAGTVPDAQDSGQPLDFRGIHAFDANTAILMSSGPGSKSRIYKTTDAGATWKLLFTNPDPKGFFDSIAFRDRLHGMVAGDPVDGTIAIFTTQDGGEHWNRERTVASLPQEGAFAASNSCLFVRGGKEAWFGTGGPGAARVIATKDGGHTWAASATPIRNDAASAGIFSLAFSDSKHGIAVGGDYAKDTESLRNIAVTSDGGHTWTAPPAAGPAGFRSAILWIRNQKMWLATGTSGSDISIDAGKTWRQFDKGSFNALSTADASVWAVGPKGRVAVLRQ